MRAGGLLLLCSLAVIGGLTIAWSGWRQPRPSLRSASRRLRRAPSQDRDPSLTTSTSVLSDIGRPVLAGPAGPRLESWRTTTRLIGRPLDVHVGILVISAIAGFVAPAILVAAARGAGLGTGDLLVPALVSIAMAIVVPVFMHSNAVSSADEIRLDMRHQLSAYLDMVTMLLAGNTGHEGALEQAATTGDGRLFHELRRRLREAGTTGQSHIRALEMVGDDFDLDELRQFAAAAKLTAAEGAPVARTLAAKCATLRSTMAAEQEAAARVRNDKITPPLVGMALLFMALIIYPALQLN